MQKPLHFLKQTLAALAVLLIALPAFSQDGLDLIWITSDDEADSTNIMFLESEGFTVFSTKKYFTGTPSGTLLDTLNAANVILVSRNANSGQYVKSTDQKNAWASVTTPMIISSPQWAENRRLEIIDYEKHAGNPTVKLPKGKQPKLHVTADPTQPPFDGVSITDQQVDIFEGDTLVAEYLDTTIVGNGTLLGRVASTDPDSQWVWIAEFDAGQPAYPTSTLTQAGKRIYFPFHSGRDNVGALGLNEEGKKILINLIEMVDPTTNVVDREGNSVQLGNAFPNPATEMTTIDFSVTEFSRVSIDIYDLTGRAVRSLVNKQYRPGDYTVQWDLTGDNGIRVPQGAYLYQMKYGNEKQTRTLIIR